MLISVVIPTFQRRQLLARCLDCLAPGAQSLPAADYEVIVSDDDPAASAEPLVRECYSWARWVQGPQRGPAANRNCGVRHARGDWVAFVDDDCEPDRAWLHALATPMADGDVDVLEGKTLCPGKRDTPLEEHIENLAGGVFWTCNLAIRARAFQALGGFDEDFLRAGGEDMEFAARIRAAGLRRRFLPEALVVHPPRRMTWTQFARRTFHMRWMVLYRLKTNPASGKSGPVAGMVRAAARHLDHLVRTTWHFFRDAAPGRWRARAFHQAWQWLVLPVMLPYLMYWDVRFRRQLKEPARSTGGTGRP